MASKSDAKCVDNPNWHWDNNPTRSCKTMTTSMCAIISQHFPSYDGTTANDACCMCGGGSEELSITHQLQIAPIRLSHVGFEDIEDESGWYWA
jgi:hypothetical protein